MERKEAIRSACRLVWDMDKRMCSEYQEKAQHHVNLGNFGKQCG